MVNRTKYPIRRNRGILIHPEILSVFYDSHDGDRWGATMGMLFGLCYVMYAVGEEIPSSWEFRTRTNITTESIREEDSFTDSMILDLYESGDINGDDMRTAGEVFGRYRGLLDRAGLSY